MKTDRITRYLLAAMLLTIWTTTSHATLVGYWNFNEGTGQLAADSSSFGNTGTLGTTTGAESTDPVWTASGGGRTGAAGDYALVFDGATSNKRVTVADSSSLDIGGAGLNDAITFSAWVKGAVGVGDPSQGGNIVTKRLTGSSAGWPGNYQFEVDGGADYLNFVTAGGAYTANFQATGTYIIHDGIWKHVAAVLQEDGAGNTVTRFYVNGVPWGTGVTTLTGINFAQNNNDVLLIGVLAGPSGPFNGFIDDVAIWDHALNPAQIAQLSAGTRSVLEIVPEPSTVLLLGLGGVLMRWKRRSGKAAE